MLTTQQKDEVDALQKKLLSNKCALDAMKKILDNEKAFRICADEEIKNLKEQIKNNANKYKSLENENEKLISEKLKIEEAKNKISQQCNELIEKNISLENHCEKKEKAFDEQTKLISQMDDNICELNDKMNNYVELLEENKKLANQVKTFSKQMETYENEREVYVQRLQKMQKEENEFNCIVKNLKKEIDVKNNQINNINENNSNLSANNSKLTANIKNLQTNFTSCLKLLDDIFNKYVENQVKQNKTSENDDFSLKLEPFLNEAFEMFEQTLIEYRLLKLSHTESETALKDEINQKENMIVVLKNKINFYKQEVIKNENINSIKTTDSTENMHVVKNQNGADIDNQSSLNGEIDRNLRYINTIKTEFLHKQKLLVSECSEFIMEKINEIENLNNCKNTYIKNISKKIDNLKKEISDKNSIIKDLNNDKLKLEENIKEKNALYNEMQIELQNVRDNFGNFSK